MGHRSRRCTDLPVRDAPAHDIGVLSGKGGARHWTRTSDLSRVKYRRAHMVLLVAMRIIVVAVMAFVFFMWWLVMLS